MSGRPGQVPNRGWAIGRRVLSWLMPGRPLADRGGSPVGSGRRRAWQPGERIAGAAPFGAAFHLIMRAKLLSILLPLGLVLALVAACPAAADEGSLRAAAATPAGRSGLALAELRRVAGPGLAALAETPDGKRFATALTGSPALLDELMGSGPLPDDPAKTLRILFDLWTADPAGFANPMDRGTAVAVALTYGDSKWPADQARTRYAYFRDSRKAGLLHPQFDDLLPWEKRYLVSAGSNGGWGGWDDASLVWLRDNVKLRAKDYVDACWQAPYRSDNLFGDSIHGSRYYAPFDAMIHAHRVRDVGGVCGSLSHYGATAARANGIPAITMGEPGHCAYAVRVARGNWVPAYSLSWQRGLHTSLWGRTWTQLVLQEKVLGDRPAFGLCMAHLWQARAVAESDPELAEIGYRLALEAQPLNQPAWLEATAFLKDRRKPDAAGWEAVLGGVLKALADYPEAAWDVVAGFQPAAFAVLPEERRPEFLLAYHRAIASRTGPEMWEFGKALEAQAGMVGGDAAARLAFFEKVLAIQAGSKSWFAPTIAWGQGKFATEPATAKEFFAVLARVFASDAAGADQAALRSALRPAVLAAAANRNVEAFQALGKAGAVLRTAQSLKTEPFPGELLTSGGLLAVSSTSGWDSPEDHWGVLEEVGGRFHTENQVRPHAIVRLGRLGDLTGIVIHDPSDGHNATRQLPLKVSVSEDGQAWTQVFRTEQHQPLWRIPLAGKATRVQFIKVERDDDRSEFFHLSAIHAYGRRLQ